MKTITTTHQLETDEQQSLNLTVWSPDQDQALKAVGKMISAIKRYPGRKGRYVLMWKDSMVIAVWKKPRKSNRITVRLTT